MALVWEKRVGHNHYQVRTHGATVRLYSNGVFHSQWNPRDPLKGSLWELLLLPAFFLPHGQVQRVLLLGVGGGALGVPRIAHPPDVLTGLDLGLGDFRDAGLVTLEIEDLHASGEDVTIRARTAVRDAALTATVTSYRPRSAIRDVGKALGLEPAQVDRLAKSLMWWDGKQVIPERFRELGFEPDSPVMTTKAFRGMSREMSFRL